MYDYKTITLIVVTIIIITVVACGAIKTVKSVGKTYTRYCDKVEEAISQIR